MLRFNVQDYIRALCVYFIALYSIAWCFSKVHLAAFPPSEAFSSKSETFDASFAIASATLSIFDSRLSPCPEGAVGIVGTDWTEGGAQLLVWGVASVQKGVAPQGTSK